MSERPWLILPIETKARELDAKTYVACAAAEAGFRVLLGEQNAMLRRLARLPRGFYLDKSIARPKVRNFGRLKKLGFRVLAWCEEGLVYRDRGAYLNERVAPKAFNEVDAFFAWGENQASDIRAAVNNTPQRIFATGNPRFDLLRPGLRELYNPEVEELRRRFGEFILINTNFGRYNHYFGREQVLEILKTRGSIRNAADEMFFRGWIDFLGQVFHSFEEMLPRLAAAFPQRTIVVRPHPSENHETWRRIAAAVPNAKVIYEGSAVPWLLAAQVSIHNSCTTGVEAALMDRPVIAYRKARSEIYDSFLPHRISLNVDNVDDLVASIEGVLGGRYQAPLASDPGVREDVGRYMASFAGPPATERILATIASLPTETMGKGRLADRIRDQGEQTLRAVARTALARFRQTGGYAKQKFPGLAFSEVEDLIARYRRLTGRFSAIQVRPAHEQMVVIDAR